MPSQSPRSKPPADARSQAMAVVQLIAIMTQLKTLGGTLRRAFPGVMRPEGKIQWRNYVLQAAQIAADLIDLDGPSFTWLSFGSEKLRALTTEINYLTEIRSFLSSLVEQVDDLLSARKDELNGKVGEITDGIEGILASRLTPPEIKDRLESLSRALFERVDEHRAAVLQRRRQNRSLLAETEQTVEQLATENQILRGATPAYAPKASRRSKSSRKSKR